MPEGHVTHRIAASLRDRCGGRTVCTSSPQGRFAEAATLLDGTRLLDAQSYGKHLMLDFDHDRTVWIHLGLIGKMRWVARDNLTSPETLRFRLAVDEHAIELRGPQWCRLITPDERAKVVAKSGPDPLRDDADPERAWAVIQRTTRTIGALLMDQTLFAGVGNIFRAEVLFRQGIDPQIPGNQLPRQTFDAIWSDLVALMAAAVKKGEIDTVHDEYLPEAMGRPARDDAHGGEVYVYRRAGEYCYVCHTPVAHKELQGRNLYWCPTCQPSGSVGKN